ncbi:MAG: ribonuclease III [Deltaproteobacteria bacterium]|nr:ribonuclease III [Deltaproteobacteria bacterium]
MLEERLGLAAGALQPGPTLEALRHGSWLHENRPHDGGIRSNERLEFLGDAVLGVCVAQRIWDRFPGYAEGELTRLRAALVKAESLAQVARSIRLGELIMLGRGEERSGGRDKQNLLADAMEAVVAAVYLSAGLERASEVVDRLLKPLFEQAVAGSLGRDFKTELQERLQAEFRQAPQYRLLAAPGPQHARTFEVEVVFQEVVLGHGTGRTKKEAEQEAARGALVDLLERVKDLKRPDGSTPGA